MGYNIGDRVKVKEYKELPEAYQSRSLAKVAGKCGVVVDVLNSAAVGTTVYLLKLDGSRCVSKLHYVEDLLTEEVIEVTPPATLGDISFKIRVLERVVVVHLLEDGAMLETGHGHIHYDGVVGIVQAASYAMKRILTKLDTGGIYVKDVKKN